MAAPVWVLSVDLQTKTATFQTGMAEAAKTARGSFTDIKAGASEMGGHVGTNMFAARHAVMALSEEFGGTMPRALTAFIAHLGPIGPALSAAFPFVAISLAAFIFFEHLAKVREEAQKLAQDQTRFGTTAEGAFNSLDTKILQAEKRSDELRNDHLGALHKELELINRQSMEELVHSFGTVEKAAETVFGDIQSHWYTMGIGATGAKHALDTFQTSYESLLAQGKDKEASDLLGGTLKSAQGVLDALKQASGTPVHALMSVGNVGEATKTAQALQAVKAAGLSGTQNELKAQETLVAALQAQLGIEQRVSALKNVQGSNATAETGKAAASLQAEAARSMAEHREKMSELAVAGEREAADAAMTIRTASIAERLASDIAFANREYAIQLQGNAQLAAALDKGSNDYANKLKAMNQKAEELTAEHANTITALQAKASVEQHAKDLADMEESEREKIDATEQGSALRLTAILNAIKNEESLNLESTAHYRELLAQKVQAEREATDAAAKIRAEAGRQDAAFEETRGELSLAALKEHQALEDSARRVSLQMQIAEEIEAANREYRIKMDALTSESAALDATDKNYLNKLHEFQDKELELTQQHENAITEAKDRAQKERNSKVQAAEQKYADAIASGLTSALMGQKSFGSAMLAVVNEVESGLLQAAIKHIETNLMTKQSDGAKAARAGFNAGLELPFPANLVAGPLFAAAMYAQVMAFEGGTDYVPGVTRGDTVPAMLTPGEGVVPGGVMSGLRDMARNGGFNQQSGAMTVHVRPTYHIQALDGSGVDTVLAKHTDKLQKHFENTLRKMGR